jgi:CRISPR-associated protein Csx10
MKKIIISCTALAPLCLRDGRKKDSQDALPYIPGTSWRGSLAWAHTIACPGKDQEFQDLFLSGKAVYSNLLPANFPKSMRELRDEVDPVAQLPLTAKTCKRQRGFLYQSISDDLKHGVRDTLIPHLLFTLSGEKKAEVLVNASKCPKENCGAVLDRLQGYYRSGKAGAVGLSELKTYVITRTGINRATGTVQENILFSREVIQNGASFWGYILLDDELEDKWCDFLSEDLVRGTIRVGSGRSSGLGKVHIEVKDSHPVDLDLMANDIKKRQIAFNDLLKKEAKLFNIQLENKCYLPLTLRSDMILRDDCMHFITALKGEWFEKTTGNKGKLVYQCARPRRISGWDGIKKLPREDVWGIAAGSVFVFALEQEPDYRRLAEIQLSGAGERVCEGYGRFVWADDLHQEVNML